jgi:hypothetical protein
MRLIRPAAALALGLWASTTYAVDFTKVPGCCNTNMENFHPTLSPAQPSAAYVEWYVLPPDFVHSSIRFADLGASGPSFDLGPNTQLYYPSFSPAADVLAAVRCAGFADRPDDNGLWLFRAGSAPLRIVAGGNVTVGGCFVRPTWIDPGALVYGGPDGGLHLALLGGSSSIPLGISGTSPDAHGTELAFVRDGDIWRGLARPEVALTSGDHIDSWPSWSGDGNWIAFGSNRSGNEDLWIVAATGGTPVQLTTHPGYDGQPSWSQDNRTILFLSDRSGTRELWMATNLPDWTLGVQRTHWSSLKTLFR